MSATHHRHVGVRILIAGNIVWAAILFLRIIADGATNDMFVNADQLYAHALAADWQTSPSTLADWALTPAPYFFPDVALYAGLHLLGLDVESASYVAGAIQLLGIAACAGVLLIRGLGVRAESAAPLTFLIPLVLWVYPWTLMPNSLFRITRHGAAVGMSYLALTWCMSSRSSATTMTRHDVKVGMVCFVAAALFAFSDPLFVVSCVLPLTLVYMLSFCQACHLPRPSGQRTLALTAGSAIGWLALGQLPGQPGVGLHLRPEKVQATLARIATWQKDYSADGWLCSAAVLASLLVFFKGRRSRKSYYRLFACWGFFSMACSWAAMLASGRASPRYLIVPWCAGLLLVGLAALASLRRLHVPGHMLKRTLTAVPFIGAVTSLLTGWSTIAHGNYRSEFRARAACVQAIAEREHSALVITDYWQAKPLQAFSDGAVQTVQVITTAMRPMVWITSRQAFRQLEKRRWNVVVANGLSSRMLKRYGPPAQREDCNGLDVRTYRGRARRRIAHDLLGQAKAMGFL